MRDINKEYNKANIKITQFPTEEQLKNMCTRFEAKMKDASAKRDGFNHVPWSPFRK